MSGNQKQAPPVVPQTARFAPAPLERKRGSMVSRFVNGPCKQEGICLLPPPPSHYRMLPPQRTDGFHVGPQQFVQQQQPPNQAGNQAPGLRGMAPTGPPTQASTPPNADLKVSHVQQQPPMNIAFVQRNQNYYSRGPPAPNQTRMVTPRQDTHNIKLDDYPTHFKDLNDLDNSMLEGQQQLFSTQTSQMMIAPSAAMPVFFNMPPYTYNGGQRPTTFVPQNFPIISGGQIAAYQPYQHQSQQYFYNQLGMQRQAPPPQVPTVPQNITHPPPTNVPMTQASQQNTLPKTKSKRRNAIPIINPETGKEVSNDDEDMSHPPSGESSARQTPQPVSHNPSKEVQATFAKQVAQVLNDEQEQVTPSFEPHLIDSSPPHSMFHQTTPAIPIHNTSRNDLVQSSKLQVPAKDFVPANQSNTAKETPVVSAISNAVEVTITNKQPKDRESPAKGRKPRDSNQREHRDVSKDAPKETHVQPEKSVKDEKQKEVIPPPVVAPVVSPVPSSKDVKEKEAPREDKKSQKKEKVEIVKPPPHLQSQEVVPEAPQVQQPIPIPAQENAKSKQNSQKAKEASKSSGPGTGIPKQQASPVIPPSQPAKPNNKSNKMKELNMKGATKEGTDMDAFNDNQDVINVSATNANIVTNDNYNSSTINVSTTDSNKKIESNEVPTIKPDVKTSAKGKIDVTDIVKEIPKPFTAPAPVESKDEPDRALNLNNEKMVQVKNEVNAKGVIENDENMEIKSSAPLPYKENQWSPLNKDGKKVYDRDFLMALKNFPKSKQKPDNILTDIIAQDDKSRGVGDIGRYAMGGRTDFAPTFGGGSNFSGKSQSARVVTTKRGSQQGKVGGGSSKGGKSGSVIRVSISFKEDVKLHETENAWKPARLNPNPQTDDEKKTEELSKTEELYKKVRGVLNKLTPQKFNTLLNQIKTLPIDTSERLQGVIDLVFEKAVDEPNFSVAYALMCRELALMQVPVTAESKEFVNFRKLLVTRCQMEFEKNSFEESNRNDKIREIDDCADPEKKKEMTMSLEEDDRRIRMKSVGNIRFIGELFKQNMLTVNIMMRCLQNLIENQDEERLECLCKLLTTIGKELESKKVDLSGIFGTMKDIVDKKNGKVSSRVRFMLQDVIDLRSSNWIPRRQDLNPKTIDQIQKEADNEQMTIQALNSGPITPRKDDRNSGPNSDRRRGGRNVTDDGWATATSRNKNTPFSVQSDKLKIKQPTVDEPLGSSLLFGSWGRGSNIKTLAPPTSTNPNTATNMYAALENMKDMDSRSVGSRPNNKDPYNSKGPSLERTYKQYEGRGSRSGSQHRPSNDTQHMPIPMQPMTIKPQPQPTTESPELIERRIKNIIAEYLNDCCTIKDTKTDIEANLPASALEQLVFDGSIEVADRSKRQRLKTGELFAQLLAMETIPLDTYCAGLEKVFGLVEELIVDVPNIWDSFAEIISAPVNETVLPLNRLHGCCNFLISRGFAQKLLAPLFKLVIEEKGPNFLASIWKSSDLSVQQFMAPNEVDGFISKHHLEFLVGGSRETISSQSSLSYDQIYQKLQKFIQAKTLFDDITNWITANVGENTKDKQFIRILATVVIESSIVNSKLDPEGLRNFYQILHRYIDNNSEYELQCLYAIQSIVNKLEHPQGLLLKLFNTLYEDNIISHDSFVTWEHSGDPAEQDNKGVALKQLTSFFTQLKENDEESVSSSSEEA